MGCPAVVRRAPRGRGLGTGRARHEGPGRGCDCRARRARAGGVRARRLFAATADEEVGDGYGLSWLCEEHPEAVRATWCINEGGGDRIEVCGRTSTCARRRRRPPRRSRSGCAVARAMRRCRRSATTRSSRRRRSSSASPSSGCRRRSRSRPGRSSPLSCRVARPRPTSSSGSSTSADRARRSTRRSGRPWRGSSMPTTGRCARADPPARLHRQPLSAAGVRDDRVRFLSDACDGRRAGAAIPVHVARRLTG